MRLRSLLLALFAGAAASCASAGEYTLLIQGTKAGGLRAEGEGLPGERRISYEFRDNGRGPTLRERVVLDAQGLPSAFEIDGTSTFGAAIGERFEWRDGRARWSSPIDQGDEPVAAGAVFLPLESSPWLMAQAAAALLTRADGTGSIVGGGRLRVERLEALRLAPTAGPEVQAELVRITGMGGSPEYVWLAGGELFAQAYPGWAMVRSGFEAHEKVLADRVTARSDGYFAELQKRLARPLSGLTRIRDVRWFDSAAGVMRAPADVYLYDGRISAVRPAGEARVAVAHEIDGAGRSLLPGLFDMHAHVWSGSGLFDVASGVTSVRDMANQNDEVARVAARIEAGEIIGPRLMRAGFIEGRSAFSARNGFVVDTLEAGLAAVDAYAARGYRQIKLYNSIKPEWVKPLAERAHRHGMMVAGHVPAFMRAEQAVRDGYDELTHINQVMLNFVARDGDDTRTLLRFNRVGEDAHSLGLAERRAADFIELLRARGVTVDPTLGTFEGMLTQAQGEPQPLFASIAGHVPPTWRRSLKVAEMDLKGPMLATYRASYQRLLDLTLAMHRAGVRVVAGTDSTPGLGLHRELELYVKAGFTPGEALQAATRNSALTAGVADRLGAIAPGMLADLALIDGDPAARISDIRRVALTIKGGVAYEPARLWEEIGFKPFAPAATIATPVVADPAMRF